MEDQKARTIAKTVSWRAIASFTTIAIVFGATGELALSLGVGAIEVVSKMVLYYGHERVWLRVAWGKGSTG